jgi:hypothetical protein
LCCYVVLLESYYTTLQTGLQTRKAPIFSEPLELGLMLALSRG